MIGDFADDLRRKSIAEEVNTEEIDGDRRGADRCGDGVDDGGVEWTGVEEEEELRSEERRDCKAAGAEEEQHTEGQGECNGPEAEQVKCAVVGAEPALCDYAADGGAEDAVENGACPCELTGFGNREADGVVKKFRNPVGDATHGEGEHGESEGRGKEGRIAKETGEGGAVGGGPDVILRAADGLAADESVEGCYD